MTLPTLLIAFDILVLLTLIVMITLLLRWSYLLNQNIGDSPVTQVYQFRILKSLVALVALTLSAAILNLVFI